ncbi:hypothetical protein PVAP13_3NG181483 [Panicum virgatum]|uniref:No apical meristem-associated C-terminal domain-containing protein n=2 Tax=Panicum virgatum TaxID=38727 RepID=A0A8T0U654_PANVG|nr:hypothetical protein PVAP13_3NG181483 [Panicum virgatum]
MGLGSYLSDLINLPVQESQDHGPAAAKGSQGRTKNFRDDEDRLLVSAWLNVGMDIIRGVDQSQASYWERIHDYFHANKSFESDRTQGSLMNRWSTIQHDVNTFCGCVTRIEDRNQSGCSVDDKIAAACALFKSEDKKHRNFALMHCWRILKDQPKWIERRKQIGGPKTTSNKKQKTKENSSPSSLLPVVTNASSGANEAPAQDSSQRPDGTKKEKKKLRQRSTIEALDYLAAKIKEADALKDLKKEERCNKVFALQEEKIKLERYLQVEKMKLEREKFEFERELEEDKIIAMDLSTIAFEEQQYFQYRKNNILERRLNI